MPTKNTLEYAYVAKCKFCGTIVYSTNKVKECDACGSTDISNSTVESFERKAKKETSYAITPTKPKKIIETISSIRKRNKKTLKKLNWTKIIKTTKIVAIFAYLIATAVLLVMTII